MPSTLKEFPIGQPRATRRPETVRLYQAEWLAFVSWCRVTKRRSLPAEADTLAAYLMAVAPGASRGTIGRKRAAIRTMHRQHDLPVPTLERSTRAALRETAAPKRQRVASSSADTSARASWIRMAMQCPRDLAGLRDRALLLLAACDQTSVDDLLGLTREQVSFTDAGITLHLVGDPPTVVPILRHTSAACPVQALEDWLQASDTSFGPVFRKVDRWGNVEYGRLGPDGLRRILARRAAARSRRGHAG